MLGRLYAYRTFVFASIRADLRGRFARSGLGALWFILNPLAQSLIFAIVLSEVLGARLPGATNSNAYPIYLLSGMAAWNLFSEIVMRSMAIFIEQGSAMKKIVFPKICLPAIVWGSALVNHFLLLIAVVLVFLAFGHVPGSAMFAVLFGVAAISLFGFGLGLTLGLFNIFSRDVFQFMTVVMQLWFWLTPLVYPKEIIPEHFVWIVRLNPMTPMVSIYQDAMLLNRWPNMIDLLAPILIGLIFSAVALFIFRRASSEIVDAL